MNIRTRHRRAAFTLVELLVVISIIAVLLALLIPLAGKVRDQARAADTRAQIASLTAAFTAYYADFNAYPGPVPNYQLRVAGPAPAGCNITTYTTGIPPVSSAAFDATKMSMAENAYLGLMGGLVPGAAGTFTVDLSKAGNGPQWLGPTPRKLKAYIDNNDATKNSDGTGSFVDDAGAAIDTVIPEFVDHFTDALPFLILRARNEAPGVVSDSTGAPAVPAQQYDVVQVASYTESLIGSGRSIKASEYTTPANYPKHGFRAPVNPNATLVPPSSPSVPPGLVRVYPYDLYAALLDPTLPRVAATAAAPANSPRQRNGYIIISAGIDRVYGTTDDITNFGSY